MKFKKILVVGIDEAQLDKTCWEKIDSLAEKRISLAVDSSEVEAELKDADCLLVYFNEVNREMLDKALDLKYIGALATGVGKVDSTYASTKNIIVTNIPGYSTESVAEFVFAILLETLRDISRGKKESKEGNRSELGFSAREIRGKKFGVLGLGRIGTRVAELASSFGANVSYWSRNKKEDKNIQYLEMETLLEESDILSIHISLSSESENLLNREMIERIKKGAIVINTSPMELLDIDALEERLRMGTLTFIFDHTDTGDISEENLKRLQKYENCITYPAIGYISDEARIAKQEIFVSNMKNFLEGSSVNKIN